MKEFEKILLVLSVISIWINSFFNEEVQLYLGFSLIFLVGILHGSNDILLISKTNTKKKTSYTKLILYYVLFVFLGLSVFFLIPLLSLLLFLLVSSYHFGEQHWSNFKYITKVWTFFQFSYGFFILLLLFKFNATQVHEILYIITQKKTDSINFNYLLLINSIFLLISGYMIYVKEKKFKNYVLINIFYLVIFAVIFKTANLIWGFSIYFVLWHSVPSIRDQVNYLYGENNFRNLKKYILKAIPFWILALIGIMIVFIFFREKTIFESMFFSFLAAITFPHVIVMLFLFKKKSE